MLNVNAYEKQTYSGTAEPFTAFTAAARHYRRGHCRSKWYCSG